MQASTARMQTQRSYNNLQREYEVIKGAKRANRIFRFKSAVFLTVAFLVLALTLTYYLTLRSSITNSIKSIAVKESKLNELKLDNDENYSRITSNINLEEVRRIAIQELGMQYAEEGQIISFNGDGADYVRQIGEIPQ